ncbi:hypothetical protein V8D89_013866 [Ganoderma adspersum]
MQNYAVTSLIGGTTPGSHSPNIFYMDHSGNFVLNDGASSILNADYPIKQISVSSGVIVDGVTVTYNLEGGGTAILSHGSLFNPPTGVVAFGTNEVLSAVYGREGYHSFYKRDMTEQSRTAGDGSNQGQPFWTSDVLALGSFAQETATLGLSGLLFFRNPSSSTNRGLTPPSNWTNQALTPPSLNSTD